MGDISSSMWALFALLSTLTLLGEAHSLLPGDLPAHGLSRILRAYMNLLFDARHHTFDNQVIIICVDDIPDH